MAENQKQNGTLLWSITVMLLTSPVFFYFLHTGKQGTGRAAWICIGMFLLVIKIRWELRSYLWFWCTIAFMLALHIPLILLVPWTSRWIPAIGILPIGVLDGAITLGVIALVEKLIKRIKPPAE